MLGLGGALWIVLISRLISGVTAGNKSVATAYIADVATDESQAMDFTLVGMAPAYLAAALTLMGLLLGLF